MLTMSNPYGPAGSRTLSDCLIRAAPPTGGHQAPPVPPVGLEPTPSRRFRPEPYPLGQSGSHDLGETRTPNLQIRILTRSPFAPRGPSSNAGIRTPTLARLSTGCVFQLRHVAMC